MPSDITTIYRFGTNIKTMRIALTILIAIHGIIHLLGFFKAFGIAEINAISQPISRTFGLVWLLGFVLFAVTAVLVVAQANYVYIIGIISVIISQFLIINYWEDAKFATLANVVILLFLLGEYSGYSFKNQLKEERIALFENSQPTSKKNVTEEAVFNLPPIVQKWLAHSGVIGKESVSTVYLVQELQLKMKPGQEEWNNGRSEQYFTVQPPAFNWSVTAKMNAVLSLTGRDKFENGKGEMTIKLFSFIPVANAKSHEKVNQASLQRYLAEIVWFPSASLSPYIRWETLDDYSAKATMEYNGTLGSGVFHFDAKGDFKKFVAMRYQDSTADKPTEWTVIATKTEERNGIKIPTECEASWELEHGEWTWLKLKITDIQYNVEEMPVVNN